MYARYSTVLGSAWEKQLISCLLIVCKVKLYVEGGSLGGLLSKAFLICHGFEDAGSSISCGRNEVMSYLALKTCLKKTVTVFSGRDT